MSWDEQMLVTASDDGCIFVYDVKDRDAKAAARREQERMEWAVEVLVTRSELDEKRSRMAELEQQVRGAGKRGGVRGDVPEEWEA